MNPGTTGLISYWSLDETSGTRVDSHGSNDLTDNNTVGSATGVVSNGAEFVAGSNEYLSRNDQTWGFSNEWSISYWFNSDTFSGNQRHFDTGSGPGDRENQIVTGVISTGLYFCSLLNSSSSLIYDGRGSSTLSINNWYHIVITRSSSGTVTIYLNGSDDTGTPNTDTGGTMTDSSRPLFIGVTDNFAVYYDGTMDEFSIWSRELTSSEVSWLYNSGSGRSYADLSGTGGDATGGSGNFLLMGAG